MWAIIFVTIDNDFSNENITVEYHEVVWLIMLRKTDLSYVCLINKNTLACCITTKYSET
jgi:hypothetical protein